MNIKERILMLRLLEKQDKNLKLAQKIGIEVKIIKVKKGDTNA